MPLIMTVWAVALRSLKTILEYIHQTHFRVVGIKRALFVPLQKKIAM